MKTPLFFVFLAVSLGMNAQVAPITDTNFKAKLLSSSSGNTIAKDFNGNFFAVDTNGDGEIQVSEAEAVKELNVSNANIASLTGITSFSYLQKLDCSHNNLSDLDISSFSDLDLDCSYNNLTNVALPIGDGEFYNTYTFYNYNLSHNLLTGLDVKNKYISNLDCSYNQLSSLDFQDRLNHHLLSLQVDNNLSLTSICKNENDVLPSTGPVVQAMCNGALSGFDSSFKNMLIYPFTDSVSNTWTLKNVNGSVSTSIDTNQDGEISQAEANEIGDIYIHQGGILTDANQTFNTTAGINKLTNLKTFNGDYSGIVTSHFGTLGRVNIDGLIHLESVNLYGFHVKSIDIKNCPLLTIVDSGKYHDYRAEINTEYYKLSNCPVLDKVQCIASNLSELSFQNCPLVKNITCVGNHLFSLDVSQLNNLETLNLDNTYFSNYLSEQIYFPSILNKLYLKNGQQETASFASHPDLQYICCDTSQVSAIQSLVSQYGYTNCTVTDTCNTAVLANVENATASAPESVSVYPNPTKGDIRIDSEFKMNSVEIYDTQGRLIRKENHNSGHIKIDIHSEASGVYYLKINTEKGVLTRKVIKN
ncbi:T9SS type A sorting domain-containing protein [Chryseobacterium phocaeense]|uniref:T9SS type A sorting domain-containing protein n=1 Tax=Chryseobacterium phocaeense TaxID=1816690 RepID=UPI0009BBB8A0|nr:T9SS type A sorting domain-containing protein [Chryseobacterium phocaeense]